NCEKKGKLPNIVPLLNALPTNKSPALSSVNSRQTPVVQNFDPMELDNSEAGKAARKAYRWANNLCGYCGKGGHRVATCPNLAAWDELKAR
ncbi:Bgt-20696-2, partial [Blumeria graminis f. sp. tritici]